MLVNFIQCFKALDSALKYSFAFDPSKTTLRTALNATPLLLVANPEKGQFSHAASQYMRSSKDLDANDARGITKRYSKVYKITPE